VSSRPNAHEPQGCDATIWSQISDQLRLLLL
jgi:hypothetical protein